MKLKVELTAEQWGLVAAALDVVGANIKRGELYGDIKEEITDQLEVQFKEWEEKNS